MWNINFGSLDSLPDVRTFVWSNFEAFPGVKTNGGCKNFISSNDSSIVMPTKSCTDRSFWYRGSVWPTILHSAKMRGIPIVFNVLPMSTEATLLTSWSQTMLTVWFLALEGTPRNVIGSRVSFLTISTPSEKCIKYEFWKRKILLKVFYLRSKQSNWAIKLNYEKIDTCFRCF